MAPRLPLPCSSRPFPRLPSLLPSSSPSSSPRSSSSRPSSSPSPVQPEPASPARHGRLARSRPKSGHGRTPPSPPRSPTHESLWSSSSPNLQNPSVIPPRCLPISPGNRQTHSSGISAPPPPADETATNHTRAALIWEDP
ncbi:hypothetical protein Rhow_000562 [Rhodococcus wratislaviensis]|uniref:Uncharacterized protein n=1 Tax=Rhodococcus wratislaviensis TaxID=44752 RepID=A0A402C2B3_RHOWR|nr:hypothetical protein Rhow_000562 [Rhodococcus wratislaviensis]